MSPRGEEEANSVPASPVKAGRGWHTLMSRLQQPLTLKERTPPIPTAISQSRLNLSNYPCIPEYRHLRLAMCRSWTSIRLYSFLFPETSFIVIIKEGEEGQGHTRSSNKMMLCLLHYLEGQVDSLLCAKMVILKLCLTIIRKEAAATTQQTIINFF
ncbi:hypothetical protein J6590_094663 [Homalodisca vitripennis]|nr:hypothetical protein J6590_094663 [Homalodisca vitripennis]